MKNRPKINAVDIITQRGALNSIKINITIQMIVSGIPRTDRNGSLSTNQTHIFYGRRELMIDALRCDVICVGKPISLLRRAMNALRHSEKLDMESAAGAIDDLHDQIMEHNALYKGAYPPIPTLCMAARCRLEWAAISQARALAEVL